MRIAVAANRASGGGLDPEPLLAAMRSGGAEVAAFGCQADELERAAAWKPDRLAVASGDGTIGPVAELAGRLDVPLAVLPTGTANDFARAYGVPDDPRAAAALAAESAQTRPLELGRLADGRTVFEGDCWQVIVAVSGAFGGGAGVAEADPDDGVLDLVILPAGSRASLARRAWGLRTRTIAQQRGVPHELGHVVEVELPDGREINVDGEIRVGGLERVTVEPRAFRLVVPPTGQPPRRRGRGA